MSEQHTKIITGKRTVTCSCGGRVEMSMEYDSYFCFESGIWLDPECSCRPGDGCWYGKRPEVVPKSVYDRIADEEYEYNYQP